jgi:pimeloyl-ACP methyl ester carboxylesterase
VSTDFLATDPPRGLTPAARTVPVTFLSAGEVLLGVLHVPAGPGPHPVVVMLHGFPGNERNADLAQALRRAGCAALVFHYRGSWGMGGDYAWGHVLADAATVVAAVPDLAAEYRLDPGRLALVGHSLGGFVALMTAAAEPAVSAVVSVSGFDFGAVSDLTRADPAVRAAYVEAFDAELLAVRGTSGEQLVTEMERRGRCGGWPASPVRWRTGRCCWSEPATTR